MKDVVDCDAVSGKFRHREKIWPCWQYTYSGTAAPEEKMDHGGFQIGEAIAKRLTTGELMSDLKLILMSDCLFGEERERVLAYQGTNNAWVKYYDKADWRRDRLTIADSPVIDAKVIPTWPVSQLEPDVFQWALILAIAERKWKYWGDSIYKQIPGSDAVLVGATITAQMESTATEARRVDDVLHRPAAWKRHMNVGNYDVPRGLAGSTLPQSLSGEICIVCKFDLQSIVAQQRRANLLKLAGGLGSVLEFIVNDQHTTNAFFVHCSGSSELHSRRRILQ
jgi:hypothetical protein